jgi:hypothetical protein
LLWVLKESASAEETSVLETMFTWLRQAGKSEELDDTYGIDDEQEELDGSDVQGDQVGAEYNRPDGESVSANE